MRIVLFICYTRVKKSHMFHLVQLKNCTPVLALLRQSFLCGITEVRAHQVLTLVPSPRSDEVI